MYSTKNFVYMDSNTWNKAEGENVQLHCVQG